MFLKLLNRTLTLGKRRFSISAILKKEFTPRRAVMYVPGDDERKLMKIPSTGVDCAVLECEDGVALNRKEMARKTIRKMLDSAAIDFKTSECAVRVNSVSSGLIADDIPEVLGAMKLPSTIFVPKVNTLEEVEYISSLLDKSLKSRLKENQINLIIYAESALSLLNLKDICERFMELGSKSRFNLDGIVFGADDFIADIGATKTIEATEILTARQLILMTAKAFRLQAIDMVFIDYKNQEGLRNQCIEGAKMGFTGKQVIHPNQVPIVQDSFLPHNEKIEWAKELIRLFKEHQREGKGAFTFKGEMIDRPLLLQAQNIVDLIEKVSRKN